MFNYGPIQFRLATSEDMVRATQRLRYRVYVSEKGWEKQEHHPNQIEADPFDPHSIHAAALTQDGGVIGTGRLILNSSLGLPILPLLENGNGFDPHSTRVAELSRLCVDPLFRQTEVASGEHRDNEFAVMNGVFHLLHQVAIQIRLTHLLMVAEKKLWILLKRQGILFCPGGKAVQYHGTRIPFIARMDALDHPLARLHLNTTARYKRESPAGAGRAPDARGVRIPGPVSTMTSSF